VSQDTSVVVGHHGSGDASQDTTASPTGGLVALSTPGLTAMAAAGARREYLLHVVSEDEPYLPVKRHIDVKVGKECPRIGAVMVVRVIVHQDSFLLRSN